VTTFSDDAASPRVSVVIPARNEERMLPLALESVRQAVAASSATAEIIVANDASTDRTAEIAHASGARVVDVELHNIGAVRNAGAAAATGEVLVFLDADTQLPAEVLAAALREIDAGAVGGGAGLAFDNITWGQRRLARLFTWYWQRWHGWAAGCFMFCRRADFEAMGGFDEQYFAAEERYFTEALRERGRFVVLREAVLTSGRKLRIYSTGKLVGTALRALLMDRDQLKRREGLDILYDAPREE
jgi:glycosyltransferase involved in cell wall biosynthesis